MAWVWPLPLDWPRQEPPLLLMMYLQINLKLQRQEYAKTGITIHTYVLDVTNEEGGGENHPTD